MLCRCNMTQSFFCFKRSVLPKNSEKRWVCMRLDQATRTNLFCFCLLLLLLLLLLQVIPVKVNYNYFTLYKASSLNLKMLWSKSVSFFVFLRCRIFIRRSHGSRLSAIVRSDPICCYWYGWMKIDRSFWYTNHVQWHTNHVKEKVKSTITADS